jgi:ABC-type nitrate/sulfonate/bicarbonate transport system substrate-binding protein
MTVAQSTPDLSRRRLLQLFGYGAAGLAAAPILAACGGGSAPSGGAPAAATTFSVQLSWLKDTEFAPLYLADSRGYYRDAAVGLKMIAGGPDIGALEGIVAGGSADIGIATDITSVVGAIADGNPLVCLGAMYQSNLNTFMSPPSAPITKVSQLVGKRLGGPQGVQPKFDAIFKLAGLKPDYKFVPVGYTADPLVNGDVDVQSAFITDEVLGYKRITGNAPALLTWTDAGLPAYTLPIFTTRKTLETKRDALKAFLRATQRGFDDDVADPTAGATLAAETYGKNAGLTAADEIPKNKAYVPLASSDATKAHGWMYIDSAFLGGPVYRGMLASGLKTAPVESVIDMSLLDELKKG